jgi:hypothetical protein
MWVARVRFERLGHTGILRICLDLRRVGLSELQIIAETGADKFRATVRRGKQRGSIIG